MLKHTITHFYLFRPNSRISGHWRRASQLQRLISQPRLRNLFCTRPITQAWLPIISTISFNPTTNTNTTGACTATTIIDPTTTYNLWSTRSNWWWPTMATKKINNIPPGIRVTLSPRHETSENETSYNGGLPEPLRGYIPRPPRFRTECRPTKCYCHWNPVAIAYAYSGRLLAKADLPFCGRSISEGDPRRR